MKDQKETKKSWGKIAWKCNQCGISIIQDTLRACPFCKNEDLKKEERE